MENFTYETGTKVLFGRGRAAEVGAEAAALGKSALIIASPGLDSAAQSLTGSLSDAGVKATVHQVSGPQATLEETTKAAKAGRDAQPNLVIALGNHVAQDIARAVAISLFDPDKVWEQLPKAGADQKPLERVLPLLTLPTLQAATGPSHTGGAISDLNAKTRIVFEHPQLAPKTTILDAELAFGSSTEESTDSAVALLVMLMDGYLSSADNTPIQDRLAETLIECIMENLPVVHSNPANNTARANLLWAQCMAHAHLASIGCGNRRPVATLAGVLLAHKDMHPGKALGAMLPVYMLATYQENPERYARFGHRIFGLPVMSPTMEEAALKGINQLKKWLHSNGALNNLITLGIKREEVEGLANATVAASGSSLKGIKDLDPEGIHLVWTLAAQ